MSLSVRQGDFLGIIGPNGAGKTTLFNLLTGLYRPTTGRIELDGKDLRSLSPVQRARLGLGRTFQTSSLFTALPVFENARLAAQARLKVSPWRLPRRDDAAGLAAAEALGRVGLEGRASHLAGSLSHGDKRKLELAILLASGADVLLLDEPMAGVNSEDVHGLVELIGDLHKEGSTVLMVEHHLAAVLGLAEAVAVLHDGRLLEVGAPEQVMASAAVQEAYVGAPL